VTAFTPFPSLRGANGSRECAPDDRLRDEAIQNCLRGSIAGLLRFARNDGETDLPDGQFAHSRHAQIARRVNLSQGDGVAEHPKSASHSQRPASIRGALRDRHERWVRDAVDALAAR